MEGLETFTTTLVTATVVGMPTRPGLRTFDAGKTWSLSCAIGSGKTAEGAVITRDWVPDLLAWEPWEIKGGMIRPGGIVIDRYSDTPLCDACHEKWPLKKDGYPTAACRCGHTKRYYPVAKHGEVERNRAHVTEISKWRLSRRQLEGLDVSGFVAFTWPEVFAVLPRHLLAKEDQDNLSPVGQELDPLVRAAYDGRAGVRSWELVNTKGWASEVVDLKAVSPGLLTGWLDITQPEFELWGVQCDNPQFPVLPPPPPLRRGVAI